MQKRRAHGLYFNCDEKFTPSHKCKGPQLLLLERSGDCSDEDIKMGPALEISLYALMGWTSKIMRVMARNRVLRGGCFN